MFLYSGGSPIALSPATSRVNLKREDARGSSDKLAPLSPAMLSPAGKRGGGDEGVAVSNPTRGVEFTIQEDEEEEEGGDGPLSI